MAALVALALGGLGTSPLWAGVYSPVEPSRQVLGENYKRFRDEALIPLKTLDLLDTKDKVDSPLNKYYLPMKKLLAAGLPESLSVDERLGLGAALIRLRRPEDAIQVLKRAEEQDGDNFLIRANLATAYHLAGGRDQQAFDYVGLALDRSIWPEKWEDVPKKRQLQLTLQLGWDKGRFDWYRRVETFYRKFLFRRWFESRPGEDGKQLPPPDDVDAIFDDGGTLRTAKAIRFVGDSGQYEPGTIATAERAKLPDDAIEIVQQLLLWLPADNRLKWLLGEVYNARGDVGTAAAILGEVAESGYGSQRLREHRRLLQEKLNAPPPSTGPPPDEPWAPGPWKMFGIGFGAGILLALLLIWQLREILRRRQRRAFAARP
jgi:hypothetical protein